MPENARVAVFEDHKSAVRKLRRSLTAAGHEIVGHVAATWEEAEELIRLIATGEIKPDVILLDHQLDGQQGEGADVAANLKHYKVEIPIIGISGMSGQPYADYIIRKWSPEFKDIGEFINDL